MMASMIVQFSISVAKYKRDERDRDTKETIPRSAKLRPTLLLSNP